MSKISSCFSNFFRTVDLFPTSNFIRYNGDADYKTVTGGVISITVLSIFIVLFFSMGLKTARKEIITASVD